MSRLRSARRQGCCPSRSDSSWRLARFYGSVGCWRCGDARGGDVRVTCGSRDSGLARGRVAGSTSHAQPGTVSIPSGKAPRPDGAIEFLVAAGGSDRGAAGGTAAAAGSRCRGPPTIGSACGGVFLWTGRPPCLAAFGPGPQGATRCRTSNSRWQDRAGGAVARRAREPSRAPRPARPQSNRGRARTNRDPRIAARRRMRGYGFGGS